MNERMRWPRAQPENRRWLGARRRWLWLLVPVALIILSLRSFAVLQWVSAGCLFVAVFAALVALAAGFVLLMAGLARLLRYSSLGMSLLASFMGRSLGHVRKLKIWDWAIAHLGMGHEARS